MGPQEVLRQAERYSRGMMKSPFDFRGYRVPFLYSTNGEIIRFLDPRHELNISRELPRFHPPEALSEFLGRDFDAALAKVAILPNDHPRILARPYQIEANAEIEKAMGARKRHMLIAMATGTGKTFMTVNEIYRLMKSGAAKRILFLVDRRALAAQAVRIFVSFEPEPGLKFNKIYQVYSQKFKREDFGKRKNSTLRFCRVRICKPPSPGARSSTSPTIERMAINLFGRETVLGDNDEVPDDDADKIDIPIHAFDLVIADECHRGYLPAPSDVVTAAL